MGSRLGAIALPRPLWHSLATAEWVDYGILAIVFVASRLVLLALGLRFELDVRWMFLADTAALRDHLFQSILYFHAYPPGMNVLTGLLLKLDANHLGELAHFVWCCAGFVLVGSLYYLARAVQLSRTAAVALAIAFSLLPQTLF
ncbi:MAG TPA: hypothetical protein VGL13_06040, partial [Polyangiaceae bacterium]